LESSLPVRQERVEPGIAGAERGAAAAGAAIDAQLLACSLRQKRVQLLVKRLLDAGGALAALVALAPLCLLAALLIRITSRGPVIFRHQRVGYLQKTFVLYKFRTMRVEPDAPWTVAQQAAASSGVLVKARHDPRVTRLGRILRSTSVDELPQLFNVLKGDMSLVGPRPLVPFMLAPYPVLREVRSLVRPGMTGLWQIRDRQHNTTASAMMRHDLEYVQRFSLGLDLAILVRTPLVVASRQGAY
jgi:lipopolysaccharide/colanic/teichoic acid biosynthesis glycosyltransferase